MSFFWEVLRQTLASFGLFRIFFFYRVYDFLRNIYKTWGLKFSDPALITSREAIVARNDSILNQSEHTRL